MAAEKEMIRDEAYPMRTGHDLYSYSKNSYFQVLTSVSFHPLN